MGPIQESSNASRAGKLKDLLSDLATQNLEPLWTQMSAMVPGSPNPVASAHIWKYGEVLPHLQRAARLVPEEQAERRVLMLVNPSMSAPHTTDTIYAGLQIVNPGETAPAHRHIAFACRFIIDGEGFTAVEGKKMPLKRGDVVVTPTWHWHDHGNESQSPIVWLDLLNLPLFRFAPVNFAEGYSDPRYPSQLCNPCEWRYPWEPVEKALNASDLPHTIHHYLGSDGQPLSTTLGFQAERLKPGAVAESRDSCSYVYHCYEGKGRTEMETPSGSKIELEWGPRDTFAVPAWSKLKLINTSETENAYLVACHDKPFLDLLKLRKILLVAGHTFSGTLAIPEKHVPSIITADGPNGVRAPATSPDIRSACFPAACSLAATFDPDLARRFGVALAHEARMKDVNCILGPTVCIHRHPLGGRNFESFSEDPLLTGKMASQVIQGLQSQGVSATIKHFAANEQETSRTSVNETISERALREIYLRPFEIAVKEANPWCLMTAYNLVNGTHCDSHGWLLRDVLRGEWKWDGLIMSDWGGTNSVTEALEAGLDLEMPGPPRVRKLETMLAKIQEGAISERDIDARARTVLSLAVKLDALKKAAAPINDNTAETGSFIRQAGARGMVLLKNEDQTLPLSKEKVKGKTIALIGYAKDALAHGGGSASVNAYYKVTPEEGLKAALKDDDVKFVYAKGAHRERLLPALSKDGSVGALIDLEGNPGFSVFIRENVTKNLTVTRHGCHTSSYSPLGSNESFQRNVELIADFTPLETGSHYFACSGLGPTRVFIDDKIVFEQKKNTDDPMGSLFNAAPEPEFQFGFTAGQKYRIRICTDPPINIGLQILEGRSGVRLGFSPQSVHDADLISEAVQVAVNADYAIIFTGHDPQWETEGQDQASFHLPHDQDGLISAVASVNKNVIVVNSTGVAVAMPWVNQIKGLVQAWFPGHECGNSIADIITGAVNPEGHLPFTIPHFVEDAPAHGNFPGEVKDGRLEVAYTEDIFVGYRHYDRISRDRVNFPFGHGLSYTEFEYGDMETQHVSASTFSVKVSVSNVGPMAGGVLVQLYAGKSELSVDHPIKTLVGFKKMELNTGQRDTVEIVVSITDLAHFDEKNRKWVTEGGEYDIFLGASAADIVKSVKLSVPGSSWSV